jgi:TusA-related sulfurtransferase
MAKEGRPSPEAESPRVSPALPSGRMESLGDEFVSALAVRDSKRLRACFQPHVKLRALVPPGPQTHVGADGVTGTFLGWFGGAESLRLLEGSARPLGGRLRISYRFQERYSDGDSEVIEQHAFCNLVDGRIATMDLVCSGHQPEHGLGASDLHHFDAGELGCGSGLPMEFRRQMNAIPIGSTLEVVARDPSAREDLPSLARLLGHRVLSIASSGDGVTVFVIERGR